jgi:hypothetical protein
MKPPQTDNPSSGTQLWYKDHPLLEQESIDEYNWIEKWFEGNLKSVVASMHLPTVQGKDKARSFDGKKLHDRIEVRIRERTIYFKLTALNIGQ